MRIAVDLTALTDRWSGLERCAYELTSHMIARRGRDHFILIVKNDPSDPVKALGKDPGVSFLRIRSADKLVANQLKLPYAVAAAKADVVLFPVLPMPLLLPLLARGCGVCGVMADAVCFDVPETMGFLQRMFWRVGLKNEASYAGAIITVSEFSAERLKSNLKVVRDKLLIVHNGITRRESCGREERNKILAGYGIRPPYLLTLSTREPRKDLPLLIRAYREVRKEGVRLPQLVIAGRSGWKDETERVKEAGILLPGFIREEDLGAVYAGAEAFLFPSYYEGFGLPPLEALACGVRRILVSDAPALKEMMGDTASYFRRRDLKSLKKALRDFPNGGIPAVSEEAAQRHLRCFSWDEGAEKVMKMLHERRDFK